MADDATVALNEQKNRYEIRVDGDRVAGFATLAERDGVTVVPHTEIAPAFGGRGLGSALVRGVLDDLRAKGATVDPQCPFVASWIQRHPEYRDMVAKG